MIRCAWSLCETLSQTLSVGMLCDRPRSKGALIFRSALASGAIHWKPTAPVALAASAFVLCARASCVPCAHHSVHVVPCARRRARSGHSSPSHGASAGRARIFAQVLMLRAGSSPSSTRCGALSVRGQGGLPVLRRTSQPTQRRARPLPASLRRAREGISV